MKPSFIDEDLRKWAALQPEKIAVAEISGKSISYGELDKMTQTLASGLRESGLTPFDSVLISPSNRWRACLVMLACLRSQLVGLVMDPRTPKGELEHVLTLVPVSAIVADTSIVPRTDRRRAIFRDDLESRDVRWMLLTSGSTGQPKGVLITHENLLARTVGEIECLPLADCERVINVLPFSHDLGLNQLLTSVHQGSRLEILSGSFAGDFINALGETSTSGITGTPHVWRALFQWIQKGMRMPELRHVRYLTISGGSLSAREHEHLRQLFRHSQLVKTYGQTETFRTLAAHNDQPGLGKPIAGVRALLIDEHLRECGDDAIGELLHFGEGVMAGYAMDHELTERKLVTRDSCLGVRTGDFFNRDKQGNFHFVGRRDDMIKKWDYRIFASEIETAIMDFERIAEVAIVAIPDEDKGGFRIVAHVCPRTDHPSSEHDLMRFCKERLSAHKVPDEIVLHANLPRTASGKPDRSSLLRWSTYA